MEISRKPRNSLARVSVTTKLMDADMKKKFLSFLAADLFVFLVFNKKWSNLKLEKLKVADKGQKWPKKAKSGKKGQRGPERLQVAQRAKRDSKMPTVGQKGRKWPNTTKSVQKRPKRPQVASKSPKWPRKATSSL